MSILHLISFLLSLIVCTDEKQGTNISGEISKSEYRKPKVDRAALLRSLKEVKQKEILREIKQKEASKEVKQEDTSYEHSFSFYDVYVIFPTFLILFFLCWVLFF